MQALQEDLQSQVDELILSGDMPEGDRKAYCNGLMTVPKYQADRPEIRLRYVSDSMQGHAAQAHVEIILRPKDGRYASWEPGDLNATFRIFPSHHHTAAQAALGYQADLNPASEQAFSRIDAWLSTCTKDHENCPKGEMETLLPTRVLYVANLQSEMVYLRESATIARSSGTYIALSHCWGLERTIQKASQYANGVNLRKGISESTPGLEKYWKMRLAGQTTMGNFPDRLQGILVNDLPQTAQDAILITRRLGLSYLWIDSLCIIQDDKEDWLRESEKMASVYLNAYLVIGASNSPADVEGFLHQRPEPDIIKFDQKSLGGKNTYLGLQRLPPKPKRWAGDMHSVQSAVDPLGNEPLTSRGWCLQERYLSRRMLLYGTAKLFWECAQVLVAEDGNFVFRDEDYLQNMRKTASIEPTIFEPRPDGDDMVNYRGWYKMVEKYMSCSLTYNSDRLPALAGLAYAVASSSTDEYWAGIWRNGWIEGLLWSRADSSKSSLKRPEIYNAPSWSWASVIGKVQFTVYNFIQRCQWKRGIADYEALATCIEHQIETKGLSSYGGVSGGYLRIKAPLLAITHMTTSHPNPVGDQMVPFTSPSCDKVFRISVGSETLFLEGGFDIEGQRHYGQLYALLLARLPDGNIGFELFIDIRFGLIVEQTDGQAHYRRVGIIDGPVLNDAYPIASLTTLLASLSGRKGERWGARSFVPGYALESREGESEVMPPDPLPEILSHMATVTLV